LSVAPIKLQDKQQQLIYPEKSPAQQESKKNFDIKNRRAHNAVLSFTRRHRFAPYEQRAIQWPEVDPGQLDIALQNFAMKVVQGHGVVY